FNNAFEFGIAQGFLEELNGKLGNTDQSLKAINEIGANIGHLLGEGFAFAADKAGPLADIVSKIATGFEYIATHTPSQALADLMGTPLPSLNFDAMNEQLGTASSSWEVFKASAESAGDAATKAAKQIEVAFPDVEKILEAQRKANIDYAESWLG